LSINLNSIHYHANIAQTLSNRIFTEEISLSELNKNILMWVVIALVLVAVFSKFQDQGATRSSAMSYSEFLGKVKNSGVQNVMIRGQVITGITESGEKFQTYAPINDPKMIDDLVSNNVTIEVEPPEGRSVLLDILINKPVFFLAIYLSKEITIE
jgi:cell division protease FtsH